MLQQQFITVGHPVDYSGTPARVNGHCRQMPWFSYKEAKTCPNPPRKINRLSGGGVFVVVLQITLAGVNRFPCRFSICPHPQGASLG